MICSENINPAELLDPRTQVSWSSPESRLNMEKQHLAVKLQTSGTNCHISPNVDIFKSRLKKLFSHVSMHEICMLSFNLSRLLLVFNHFNYFMFFSLYSFNASSSPRCNAFILCKAR